jgi:hypothetical protein
MMAIPSQNFSVLGWFMSRNASVNSANAASATATEPATAKRFSIGNHLSFRRPRYFPRSSFYKPSYAYVDEKGREKQQGTRPIVGKRM